MKYYFKLITCAVAIVAMTMVISGCTFPGSETLKGIASKLGIVKEEKVVSESTPTAEPQPQPQQPQAQPQQQAQNQPPQSTAPAAPAEVANTASQDFPKVPVNEGGGLDLGDCGRCHKNLEKFVKKDINLKSRLIFTHKIHFKKGFTNCSVCHKDPVHKADSIGRIPMKGCYQCHGLEKTAKATGKCGACHPSKFNLVPSNHNASWKPKHGKIAVKDRAYCATCHANSFCVACHRLPTMPHPDQFKQQHKKYASQKSICFNCHPGSDFCTKCHHKQYVPGKGAWKNQHPKIVKSTGAQQCFNCHDPRFCAHCHVRVGK